MRHPALLIIIATLAVTAFSQSPSPTIKPAGDDEVVRVSTNLIQVDVTVTDSKGNPVRDLRPDEFEIFENTKKKTITTFEFVAGKPAAANAADPGVVKLSRDRATLPVAPPRPENVRRTIAIVVDDLTLSFSSVFWVKEALRKFIQEQVQEGDLVAIIRTAGGIGALQQFTTDRNQLMNAVSKLKFSPYSSGGTSTFEPITGTVKEIHNGSRENGRDLSGDIEAELAAENELRERRGNIFGSGTLGAVNFIVRGMEKLPGRKSIVLLSDGFQLFARDSSGKTKGMSTIYERAKRLIELANRASVVIYSIDARGLDTPGPQAADDWTSDTYAKRLAQRAQSFSDTQDGLRILAEETGGIAFINQNDINRGLERVMNDQSYYLIGYSPDDDVFDPKNYRFNELKVVVKRPDIRVRYRSGFFGSTDEQLDKEKPGGESATINALLSPFTVNDIPIRLHTLFSSDGDRSMWLKSFLHIDANALKFQMANGTWNAEFEILAVSFGNNGIPVEQTARKFTVRLPEPIFRRVLEKGMVYQFAFQTKKPGGYQYRVALRDLATEKVGSASQYLDVPNIRSDRLTLSGVALETVSSADWQEHSQGKLSLEELSKRTDPETDTALRQFQQGRVMRYAVEIYNSRKEKRTADLSAQMKIYRDGKPHFQGKVVPMNNQDLSGPIQYIGGMVLGSNMPPGDYVLKIEVWDNLRPDRKSTQFVQFEVVPGTQ